VDRENSRRAPHTEEKPLGKSLTFILRAERPEHLITAGKYEILRFAQDDNGLAHGSQGASKQVAQALAGGSAGQSLGLPNSSSTATRYQDPSGGCQASSPRNRGNSATQMGPTRISQPV
jgi:hypothetical protein